MTKKNKLLITLPIAAISLIATTASASAHFRGGMFSTSLNQSQTSEEIAKAAQDRFQTEADLLGLSKETIVNAWAEGKTFKDIIEENGLDESLIKEKIQAQKKARLQQRLNTLVLQGVITQEQADKRLEWIKNNPKPKHLKGGGVHRQLR